MNINICLKIKIILHIFMHDKNAYRLLKKWDNLDVNMAYSKILKIGTARRLGQTGFWEFPDYQAVLCSTPCIAV